MRFLRIRDRLRRRIPPHWLLIAAAALVGLALLVSAGIMRAPHNPLTDALVSAMQSGRLPATARMAHFTACRCAAPCCMRTMRIIII